MSSAATGVKQEETSIPPASVPTAHERRRLIICLALFAATLAFYNPVAHDGFVLLDDLPYIVSNPPVLAGITWATVKWSFTTFHAGYWHPLTWLSHALDCQLFGLNPAGHHYVSLLFHAANAVLLFLLLQEATTLIWPSLIVAALFALHPVNVESVAWAAERKNVLSMFFFLWALWAYGRYVRKGSVGRYLAVAILFVLGMMAKPQIITFPCVLLLWDYWPLGRMFAKQGDERPTKAAPRSLKVLLLEKVPLFLIVIVGSIITYKAQRSADAVRSLGEFSFATRLENAIVSYAEYLVSLIWPWHLAPLYPHPGNSLPVLQVVLSIGLLIALTAAVLIWKQRRYLAVGWFWFLGVLVPMIGIVQVGEQGRADRFIYIPMIGILIAVVWSAWDLVEERNLSRSFVAAPLVVIVAALGLLTHHQLGYWKDGETLWRYTLSVTDRNYMAHDNLAMVLDKQGRVQEAIPEFEAAEALHRYPLPQVLSMGIYLQRNGRVPDALKMYQKVLNNSDDPKLQATAWSQIGSANAQIKNYDEAKVDFENALRLNGKDAGALVGAGLLAERSRDWPTATKELARALDVEATDVGFLLLADALRGDGRGPEAERFDDLARKASSDLTQARKNASAAELFFGCPEPEMALQAH